MRMFGTIFLAPLFIGLGIAVLGLTRISQEGFGSLHWGLAILAVLLAGVMIGILLNFAVFAPVYWFLGRRYSKKIATETKHDPEA